MEQHLNDHFQVCAAALCLEERTGRTITYGEIFYHKHEIKPEDFHKSLGAYRLKDNARKTFLQKIL
ncbi:MAG: hypothetical protein PT120_00040 [Aphanizomenon gracile PMC649.10]|jgi:CRISPR/Cas system-associated exonuclease Cas4 (RecB family)|uniref:hypothetical protein n=1 Tax=Dolichospermum sp. LEGE 00240 TaxID=1828603 RepID=UPI002103E2F0|nr:hypothetical protein [Dolichospermum sp. LEGE 00240]MDM3846553.1 hypothetical protein [Aphanizomenon gracile PMC638.10]MDM3848646.1 hypothetical protein [Aphanizomenon gracile PMC627.10]MDM3853343.1 hypothetical protein [Aphanizomenon gracile PMC649.10]MDM3861116.1 hypothetical protein [Aphanizomenon gracile PMC644.10]